jgi:hypothetical protein
MCYRYLITKTFKIKVLFAYYLFATVLMSYASFLVIYTERDIDNNWNYNLLFLLTICVFSWYFHEILVSTTKKHVVISLFLFNLGFFIIYNFYQQHFYEYNNQVYAFCFLSIVVYCLLYFYQLIRNVTELNILHQFDFWLISGYLLYFLSCFFIILVYGHAGVDLRRVIWASQNIVLFLSSVITITGNLWINYHKNQH